MGPPPGTLGRTYRRLTRPIPDDLHPRAGLLEIRIPEDVLNRELSVPDSTMSATARGMEGYLGDDGLWHLEAKELLPGIPHVYDIAFRVIRVEVQSERKYGRMVHRHVEIPIRHLGYRTVRLIPGRIVELTY